MSAHPSWLPRVAAMVFALAALMSRAEQPATDPATLGFQGVGKGTVSLKGPCRFHTGDNPAWAAPTFDDSAWKQIATDHPWGEQGYERYTGFAWYRCHITLAPAPGVPAEFSLLLQRVFNAYEVYWNGRLIGREGNLDPRHPLWYYSQPPRIFSMGSTQQSVLAVRVWQAPLFSDDSGQNGGFGAPPLIGSPDAIATAADALNYKWLSRRQFVFGENLLYLLIAVLSFLAWIRHRKRFLLFWMGAFAAVPPLILLFLGANVHWSYVVAVAAVQPIFVVGDVALWFLLLSLLLLRENRPIVRLTRILACVTLTDAILDSVLLTIHWGPRWIGLAQIADGITALVYTVVEAFPLVLVSVAFSRRKRFDTARWTIAILAVLANMIIVVRNAVKQGRQFTNWSIASKIDAPLFTLGGSAISLYVLINALLLMAVVYAVYSRVREDQRQKSILEREKLELTHAREQMRHHAEHDDLTGLWNHRIIMERLAAEIERSRREGSPLSVILADIDHFKSINDNFGHPTGDLVLREISAIFTRFVRPYDWVGRYGGEEFLLILPGTTLKQASQRAEEMRSAVQAAHIATNDTRLRLTSSFGVASGCQPDCDAKIVVQSVDEALYKAKRNGRNCVITADVHTPVAGN